MPELPEAETIARGLGRRICGHVINDVVIKTSGLRKKLNRANLLKCAKGHRVLKVYRRGKAVLIDMDGGGTILMQLGMTGACRVCPEDEPLLKHEHVVFDLDDGSQWRFEDPRRFGMIEGFFREDEKSVPVFLKKLGPEPFGKDFSAEYLFRVTRKRSRPIKEILLDQKSVAGIGNIYVSELLFRAGVRPERKALKLTRRECERIVRETVAVLKESIEFGGTTISDYKGVDGSEGKFVRELRVYGQSGEPCGACSALINKVVIGGRATYYCPKCQK